MSVFHLKYRPQRISELDLSEVAAEISRILQSKEIPQSLLFAGPKGSGKTSAARIVARALNCLSLKNGEPCGKCENCREILSGNSLDVMEIDAASNRGIEEARSLKDKAYLSPSHLKWKVFIIDEVHMMTRDAFNALLKLIEEPPKQTVFILCTTDEEKIPETVLSRLLKVRFYKGSQKELEKSLLRVVEGENVKIDKAAIKLLLQNSDGSFRNLHKTFTEIYLKTGNKITAGDVEEYFSHRHGEYRMEDWEQDLLAGDAGVILKKIEDLAESGVNFKALRERLLTYFQGKLLAVYGIGSESPGNMEAARLEKWLQLLINAGKQEKDVFLDQLPLQLAVIELLGVPKNNGNDPEPQKKPAEKKEAKAAEEMQVSGINEAENQIKITFGVEKVEEEWTRVLSAVKPFNHSVEAFLRAARPKKLTGRTLSLEVFYPFHKDKLEEPKNRKIVEEGLLTVFGVEMELQCTLGQGQKKPLVIGNDTPQNLVSENLDKKPGEGDIYDIAKQIFG